MRGREKVRGWDREGKKKINEERLLRNVIYMIGTGILTLVVWVLCRFLDRRKTE